MIKAVLFDLDGTLVDTAPDLGHALNRQRIDRNLPVLSIDLIRVEASVGARGLLDLGFNIKPGDSGYEAMRNEFLNFYAERLCHDSHLFPGIAELLDQLDARRLIGPQRADVVFPPPGQGNRVEVDRPGAIVAAFLDPASREKCGAAEVLAQELGAAAEMVAEDAIDELDVGIGILDRLFVELVAVRSPCL